MRLIFLFHMKFCSENFILLNEQSICLLPKCQFTISVVKSSHHSDVKSFQMMLNFSYSVHYLAYIDTELTLFY